MADMISLVLRLSARPSLSRFVSSSAVSTLSEECEIEEFLKFREAAAALTLGQRRIDLRPAHGVEQLEPRFGDVPRRRVDSRAQQLGKRIAGLILERQLLLPPHQQTPAVFLDLFVGGMAAKA